MTTITKKAAGAKPCDLSQFDQLGGGIDQTVNPATADEQGAAADGARQWAA